jgi:RHS repeat-associated protein
LRYIDSPVLPDYDPDANAGTGGLGKAASGLEQRVYYLTDGNFNPGGALSGVTGLAGTDGSVLERYAYDAYGQPRFYAADWSTRSQSSYANAILFCGYFRDAETGLYHVRHRYYHPRLGRWLSRDPIGYASGMGVYEYCMGSPTPWADPSGLDIWIEGPTDEEIWLHKGICVGDPNGDYES